MEEVPAGSDTVAPSPRIGGGQDNTAWVGGSNIEGKRGTRPESTLARRPTDFKSAAEIEKRATQGLAEDRHLSLDKKTSKITLTSWVNALRAYCEEHGMDTVFRIYDLEGDSEVYLLKEWGAASPEKVIKWEAALTSGIGESPPCDYDINNLKWSGKAIMNSIALDLWETIEKEDVGIGANGPATYTAVIAKIQQVSASAVRTMVNTLKQMSLIKEPGQDVETFGSKIVEMARRITGSGSAPSDLTSIVAGCFVECDVLAFKLKALQFADLVDTDPKQMSWEEIVRQLKAKYLSLLGSGVWEPQKSQTNRAEESVLDGLHAAINKLSAQVEGGGGQGGGQGHIRCRTCNQDGHVRADCPNNRSGSGRGGSENRRTPPSDGAPTTKMVGGVSQTWCSKCRLWTKGAKEHTTAKHVRGGPDAATTPAAAPAPVAVGSGGTITGALASGASEDTYSGGRLTFNGGLFLGSAKGTKEPPSISDPLVSHDDPSVCARMTCSSVTHFASNHMAKTSSMML
jgi:hypothetical protein